MVDEYVCMTVEYFCIHKYSCIHDVLSTNICITYASTCVACVCVLARVRLCVCVFARACVCANNI